MTTTTKKLAFKQGSAYGTLSLLLVLIKRVKLKGRKKRGNSLNVCVCVHASGLKESKVQKKEQSVD